MKSIFEGVLRQADCRYVDDNRHEVLTYMSDMLSDGATRNSMNIHDVLRAFCTIPSSSRDGKYVDLVDTGKVIELKWQQSRRLRITVETVD